MDIPNIADLNHSFKDKETPPGLCLSKEEHIPFPGFNSEVGIFIFFSYLSLSPLLMFLFLYISTIFTIIFSSLYPPPARINTFPPHPPLCPPYVLFSYLLLICFYPISSFPLLLIFFHPISSFPISSPHLLPPHFLLSSLLPIFFSPPSHRLLLQTWPVATTRPHRSPSICILGIIVFLELSRGVAADNHRH